MQSKNDLSCTPPRYLIFFKAQDADALNAAFKEYSAAVLNKAERPSVLAKLHDLAQVIANLPDKVRHKEAGTWLMNKKNVHQAAGPVPTLSGDWAGCDQSWRGMAAGRG